MKFILRLFHTVKYLKIKQIIYQVKYRIVRPKKPSRENIKIRKKDSSFSDLRFIKNFVSVEREFRILNRKVDLVTLGWQPAGIDTLVVYHLHYFDNLSAVDADENIELHSQLLEDWIINNKSINSVGWEPYPTSRRIVNWIKWDWTVARLPDHVADVLAIQASHLFNRLEFHLLGNHLIANAKALIFAGTYFSHESSAKWLTKGLTILEKEIEAQVLSDGGHFELSPMYHSIVLNDLLDLINLSQAFPAVISEKRRRIWIQVVQTMMQWLTVMTHSDRFIPFFNDSCLGVAPSVDQLLGFCHKLGIIKPRHHEQSTVHLPESGFIRVKRGAMVAFLNVGDVGASYLPGHGHADSLSFELSIAGKRFLVNTGISQYELTPRRLFERSTEAHNTVVIDGLDSSDVWGSFRVGRRARVSNICIEDREDYSLISAQHDGYLRFGRNQVHQRKWLFSDGQFVVEDKITSSYGEAFCFFYLHPNVKILDSGNNKFVFDHDGLGEISVVISDGSAVLEDSRYAPEFGLLLPTKRLRIEMSGDRSCKVKFSWLMV